LKLFFDGTKLHFDAQIHNKNAGYLFRFLPETEVFLREIAKNGDDNRSDKFGYGRIEIQKLNHEFN
jgi:hypothetical protein